MRDAPLWPTLNAGLNLLAFSFLVLGYRAIRARRIEAHRRAMIAAFASSTLFLASYLVYHFQVGSVSYQGAGLRRTFYQALLLAHTVLAAAVAPMAVATLGRGLRGDVERHRRLARRTLPVWVLVSVSGVLVYLILYRLPV
jgi:uncharacterized membrane protein YozB (DUF420 family)